jgi:DNA-binding CsgD family transcriptional regulator/tetratricopeptide (TPR) repeat protein
MAARVTSPRLVGRAEESARLAAALDRAAAGDPAAVLVAGEAGVGKTRLVTEFTSRATNTGACVLIGGCVALVEGELAYAPLVEALRGLLQRLDPTAVTGLLEGGRSDLARLLPELSEADRLLPAPDPPAGAGQARLFAALVGLLRRLSQSAPVLVVVEDLHWVDHSTLEFLSYLLHCLRDERLLLVASYRSDELPGVHPVRRWVAQQHRSGRVEHLELQRLTRAELAEQLTGILGAPTPGLVEEVFARSEGNPFFAEELVASSARGVAGALPARLREVLLVRVGECSPTAQAVLRVAAVAGRRVDERLLVAVAPLGEAELLAGLREAVDRQLLVIQPGQDTYTFRHALLQEAVYGELLPGERIRLHMTLAQALSDQLGSEGWDWPASAAEVAVHWHRARELPRALEWSVRAAVEADAMHAHAETARHYLRALEVWDRVSDAEARAGVDRVEVLQRAARAANASGDVDRALALIEQALGLVDPVVDPVRAGLLHERRGLYLFVTRDLPSRFEALREAVRLIPADPPSRERARVLASYAEALVFAARIDEARTASGEAAAIARQLGADLEVGRALVALGWTQVAAGDFQAGIASLREACRLAEQHADLETLGRAYGWLAEALMQAGHLQDAVEVSLSGRGPLRRLGLAGQWQDTVLLSQAAEALFKLGRWDQAHRLAAQALAQATPDARSVFLTVAELEIGRGEFPPAEAHLELIKERSLPPAGTPEAARVYAALTAELGLWQGRLAEAQAAVQDGLDRVAETDERVRSGRLLWLGMRIQADRAELGRARRDQAQVEAAIHAADALASRAAAMAPNAVVPHAAPIPASSAVAALFRGERSRLEGRPDPAHWQAAASAWLALGRPYPAAYAQWRQAEALLLGKQPASRAVEPLRAAHATALRLGARPLLRETKALASRARITLEVPPAEPAPTPSPVEQFGLTARELEVLRHVAAGRSNREIGEALFITAKTASVHISNILRKLQVTSRVQAATAAHRLGLVDEDAPEVTS